MKRLLGTKENFTAEELIDFLLSLGFKETTQKHHPKHWEKIQNDGYNPECCKRRFEFNKLTVYLDYINVRVIEGCIYGTDYAITRDSLRRMVEHHSVKRISISYKEAVKRILNKCRDFKTYERLSSMYKLDFQNA